MRILFAAVHESVVGPSQTSDDVRFESAIGVKADFPYNMMHSG
jgi:hypothetical protein